MIVLDASAAIELLVGSSTGARVGDTLAREEAHAPEVFYLEVLQTLRRLSRHGALGPDRAGGAVDALGRLPLNLHSHSPLRRRVWELRDRCSSYDGAYVALAEALGAPLLTTDARLVRAAAGLVEVFAVGAR